jgi:hypothetical protein
MLNITIMILFWQTYDEIFELYVKKYIRISKIMRDKEDVQNYNIV